MHAAHVARPAAGPNLVLTALLLTAAYLADLALTMAGHRFLSPSRGFDELNPVVGAAVEAGDWLLPAGLKLFGVMLLWYGVHVLGPTPWRGRYAWLLGGFAVLYILLNVYQVATIHGVDTP